MEGFFDDGADFATGFTRDRFEKLCEDLFQHLLEPVERVLRASKMDKSQIDEVVLVGDADARNPADPLGLLPREDTQHGCCPPRGGSCLRRGGPGRWVELRGWKTRVE